VLDALQVKEYDVLGFSMGGCAAQMHALNAPDKVRRLILAGTAPSAGEGVERASDPTPFMKIRTAMKPEEFFEGIMLSFYAPSERSQDAGRASLQRIRAARPNPSNFLGPEGIKRQQQTYGAFSNLENADEGSYNRLREIRIPVLIANGTYR
jgi:pimeloyl-ACP methyl ester carboxylesterase